MTMTEKKACNKALPLWGRMWRTEPSVLPMRPGKRIAAFSYMIERVEKKTHRVPFRQEERMGNVYCKYLELEPEKYRVSVL